MIPKGYLNVLGNIPSMLLKTQPLSLSSTQTQRLGRERDHFPRKTGTQVDWAEPVVSSSQSQVRKRLRGWWGRAGRRERTDRNGSSPFWGLMIKDCVAPFTSRQ